MRIFVFGDSITHGYHDLEQAGWANRLHLHAMRLEVESDWEQDHCVFTLGIPGDGTDDIVARIDNEITVRAGKNKKPTLSIIAVGVIDSGFSRSKGENQTDIGVFEGRMRAIVACVEKYGPAVLVGIAPVDDSQLDPMPWHPEYSYLTEHTTRFDAVIRKVATEHDVSYVSMDGVFGDDIAAHTTDGIHPNAEGHRLMFERVKAQLEKDGVI